MPAYQSKGEMKKMELTLDQMKEITTGAAKIAQESGRYRFFRFNDHETEVIKHVYVPATAGIQMKFKTDGRILKLKVYTEKALEIRSFFSFDIFIDNQFAGSIQNLSDDDCTGDYANLEYTTGSFYDEFALGDGEKEIRICFPHSVVASIEHIEITDATYIVPVKKEKTIIFYGDSITQGFDALHPSKTYAALLAEALDADIVNKAIGGARFNPKVARLPSGIQPDYVVIAYGTNDWTALEPDDFRANVEGFCDGIQQNYPDVPMFVITPVWRRKCDVPKRGGEFSNLEKTIREVFEKHKNVTVIPGFDLVPHDVNMYGDLRVHPSDKGFAHYVANLKKYLNI